MIARGAPVRVWICGDRRDGHGCTLRYPHGNEPHSDGERQWRDSGLDDIDWQEEHRGERRIGGAGRAAEGFGSEDDAWSAK